jgi:hypothetical protein
MNTLSQLIARLREKFGDRLLVRYLHPLLYLVCIDESFEGSDNEQRLTQLAKLLEVGKLEIQEITSHGVAQIVLTTSTEFERDYAFIDAQNIGQHWLAWYGRANFLPKPERKSDIADTTRALHFYGFKGGQARSTVLVLLAKSLADDGARVLIVDADVEAPSLDTFFDVAVQDPAATLMGLCGWAQSISPVPRVYVGRPSAGTVDLLACAPRSESYEMDFAGFLLSTAFDARVLQEAAKRLKEFASSTDATSERRYDFVFFDHRTGLAPSVLPIMEGWPGPTVIFVRPDGLARHVDRAAPLRPLLSYDSDSPGAFVSFSLDPKQSADNARELYGRTIERLLEILADALSGNENGWLDIDPAVLERYWIFWQHDTALLMNCAPMPSELSTVNQAALLQLREVLDLDFKRGPEPKRQAAVLTKSGSTDQGIFILTPDVERLFSLESKILYILEERELERLVFCVSFACGNSGNRCSSRKTSKGTMLSKVAARSSATCSARPVATSRHFGGHSCIAHS